jgi:hypothetical protein
MSVEGSIMCALAKMVTSWVRVPGQYMGSSGAYTCSLKSPSRLSIAVLEQLPLFWAPFARQPGMCLNPCSGS